ncbi:hypothetical protein CYY_002861 [Polysphondylium violaceum]|uniref:Uncharacterized protein n=1 Tax=Polysphondylium violaceum TaxID=133409 RepID=A0A8J4V6H1_9MYCE|nr:hypothetical protein CYY_002861 [Polysphondylium violaceum]
MEKRNGLMDHLIVASTRKRVSTDQQITASQPNINTTTSSMLPVVGRSSKKQKVIENQSLPDINFSNNNNNEMDESIVDSTLSQPQASSGYNFFSSQNTTFGGGFSMDPFSSQSNIPFQDVYQQHSNSNDNEFIVSENEKESKRTKKKERKERKERKEKKEKDKKEKKERKENDKKDKKDKKKEKKIESQEQPQEKEQQDQEQDMVMQENIPTLPITSSQTYNFFSTPFSFNQENINSTSGSSSLAWDLPSFTGEGGNPAVIDPNEHSYSFFSSFYNQY